MAPIEPPLAMMGTGELPAALEGLGAFSAVLDDARVLSVLLEVKGGLAVGPAVVDTDVVVLGAVGIAIYVLDEWAAAGIWLGARLLALLVADGAGVVGSLLGVMVFAV